MICQICGNNKEFPKEFANSIYAYCSDCVKKEEEKQIKLQSKLSSLIESITNIVVGYTTAVVAQVIIFPLFDINVPLKTNLFIGIIFTFISLVRSYFIRRFFNSKLKGKT